ncbi:hypothetical protein A6V29_10160 [Blastococcus sp. CCUG 61487]|nr:hypothetical protein A6V29_10160 [Blastococcus sp. CCUG 61487]
MVVPVQVEQALHFPEQQQPLWVRFVQFMGQTTFESVEVDEDEPDGCLGVVAAVGEPAQKAATFGRA